MIPYGKHHLSQDDIDAVVEVLKSGRLTQGLTIPAFEQQLADYVGARYAVAVSSGTAALHIAALAAGVSSGENLLTSPITFVASANAGIYAGGEVNFADIDSDTINLSPTAVKTFLEKEKFRAIIPVHFAGLPCDMSVIKSLADAHGSVVIEDAAHALGARYEDGGMIGSCKYSLMTVFSLHPVKAIAAGEGGVITTNDENIYRRLLRLRSHGINKLDDPLELKDMAFEGEVQNPWYYEMQELGFNYRITDIQCALAISQLHKIENFMDRRKALVEKYLQAFSEFNHCSPAQKHGAEISGNHLFVLRIRFDEIGLNRAELMEKLREGGVGTQVHYIPVPAQPFYRKLGFDPCDYPNSLNYYSEALSIPLYYDLSDEEQDFVISIFRELVG